MVAGRRFGGCELRIGVSGRSRFGLDDGGAEESKRQVRRMASSIDVRIAIALWRNGHAIDNEFPNESILFAKMAFLCTRMGAGNRPRGFLS
jgi:hypothetical protein